MIKNFEELNATSENCSACLNAKFSGSDGKRTWCFAAVRAAFPLIRTKSRKSLKSRLRKEVFPIK